MHSAWGRTEGTRCAVAVVGSALGAAVRRAPVSEVCTVRRMNTGSTSDKKVKSSRLSKFHTLDIPARVAALEKAGFLTSETRAALEGQGLALADANNMIENVLAIFGVPMVRSPASLTQHRQQRMHGARTDQ